MKPVLLIPVVLSAALGSASPSESAVPNRGADDTPIAAEPANDVVWARAHVTVCTNALDGSESFLSHSLCSDGWGPDWEWASYWALVGLASQTCLGPQWGCCEFVVDQDFNACGK
jgi:hypothetical protein